MALSSEKKTMPETAMKQGPAILRLLPTWRGNLMVFGLLILVVLAYFYWQIHHARGLFFNHVREHTRMLAGVIQLNIGRAVLSNEVVEEILSTYLGNMARFVDYLDTVEPFTESELTAFAAEAGLSGIGVYRGDGSVARGPAEWATFSQSACGQAAMGLQIIPKQHGYTLTRQRDSGQGCIQIGVSTDRIEQLHEQISLPHFLDSLSGVTGVRYVRVEKNNAGNREDNRDAPEITLLETPEQKVAQARLPIGQDILVVGLDASPFFLRAEQLRGEFFLFSALLAGLGILFSWLLYRFQAAYLQKVRQFDREIARQHEDATLGRAAASLTHEIRNPLNAISMGLQRLQMEAEGLAPDHQKLLADLRQAVARTNGIVTDLKRFSNPLLLKKNRVDLNAVTDRVLGLYRNLCLEKGVEVKRDKPRDSFVIGDEDLLEEVVENLVKNAIEAQPRGGFLRLFQNRRGEFQTWSIENGGLALAPEEVEKIFEPYFTTKTRGTGIGLSIVRRIVRAHGGKIEALPDKGGTLTMKVFLKRYEDHPEE